MKINLKPIKNVILSIAVAFALSACGKSETNKDSIIAKPKDYTPQAQELIILDRLTTNELVDFLDGQETLLFEEKLIATSAVNVSKEYNDNQVSADQKFYKKRILVNGIIASINSGLGNEPYISLRGENVFMNPQIHFSESNIEKIAKLKKSQKLSFVCEGGGSVAGVPIFRKCIFADDYAAKIIATIKPKVQSFLAGNDIQSDTISQLAIGTIVITRELPKTSTCFTDGTKCSTDIQKLLKDKIEEKMATVTEELRLLDIKIPQKPNN